MLFVRSFQWLCLALLALPAIYFGALYAAGPLFTLRTPIEPVDVIVVLGGDGPARAAEAADLYRSIARAEPHVLVSGDGDCRAIAELMIGDGVAPDRVMVECTSGTTWENAKFSEPILARLGARSGILVTSWFHMRRALACFRALNPQIAWGAAPVERHHSLMEIAWEREGVQAAKEFLKVGWYVLRYGLVSSLAGPAGSET